MAIKFIKFGLLYVCKIKNVVLVSFDKLRTSALEILRMGLCCILSGVVSG